jgi:hypothetical protein
MTKGHGENNGKIEYKGIKKTSSLDREERERKKQ